MKSNQWKFVYVTDMQPGSPKSYRFRPSWAEKWQTAKNQILQIKPDVMLIGGDVTRDGSIHKWELREMKNDLYRMGVPYYLVPGNMDTGNKHTNRQGASENRDDISLNITSGQLKNWKDVFGDWKWTFTHKNVRVSGFCDMLINSNLPEEKELWDWLEEQKKHPRSEYHIWMLHYALFIDRPDEPNWDITKPEEYLKWYFTVDLPGREELMEIFKATGAARVISGHVHCQHDSVFHDMHFDCAPAICETQFTDVWPEGKGKQGFYVYHAEGGNLNREFVPLKKISTRKDGYGPSGHPKPEIRDYSIAWEK